MPTHRSPAAAVFLATVVLASALLSTDSASAAVAPEPGAGHVSTSTAQPVPLSGDHSLGYLSRQARAEAFAAQRGVDLSDYPGGGSGASNGVLSAAQRGEPVGAGGTSGGSWSPFALASEG